MIECIIPSIPPNSSIQYFPTCIVVLLLHKLHKLSGDDVEGVLKCQVIKKSLPPMEDGLEGRVDVGDEEVVKEGGVAAFVVRRMGAWERDVWVVGYKGWYEVVR
jgi:hypothetical protein